MAPNSWRPKLQLTPIYSIPSHNSTSNLCTPPNLSTPSFDTRPDSSPATLTPQLYRKNMREMTTGFENFITEEEFHSLPPALKRKYFSSLERLRFAQSSRSNAFLDLPPQSQRNSSIADRRGINISELEPRRRPSTRRLRKKRHSAIINNNSNDRSWFLSNYETFPEAVKRKQFTKEEQLLLGEKLRETVILDGADENLIRRRMSRRMLSDPPPFSPALLPPSIKSSKCSGKGGGSRRRASTTSMADILFESFRWIDEDSKLDLRLDDYHASLLPPSTSNRKPSFRRQMSVSKLPFGKGTPTSPISREPRSPKSPKSPKAPMSPISTVSPKQAAPTSPHKRSKSRTASHLGPKHKTSSSASSIDPRPAHYQDPEARLKLRVYLASPQKFDEIIEFGFPSIEQAAEDQENRSPYLASTRHSRDIMGKRSPNFGFEHSFFNDDTGSLFEDDTSMAESEAPLTPLEHESGFRLQRSPFLYGGQPRHSIEVLQSASTRSHTTKQQDPYAQVMAGNREMTLRMTLTRPDLRADESDIYGSQAQQIPFKEEPLILEDLDKSYPKGPLGGEDGWGAAEKENANGVVKRFWNRFRKPL